MVPRHPFRLIGLLVWDDERPDDGGGDGRVVVRTLIRRQPKQRDGLGLLRQEQQRRVPVRHEGHPREVRHRNPRVIERVVAPEHRREVHVGVFPARRGEGRFPLEGVHRHFPVVVLPLARHEKRRGARIVRHALQPTVMLDRLFVQGLELVRLARRLERAGVVHDDSLSGDRIVQIRLLAHGHVGGAQESHALGIPRRRLDALAFCQRAPRRGSERVVPNQHRRLVDDRDEGAVVRIDGHPAEVIIHLAQHLLAAVTQRAEVQILRARGGEEREGHQRRPERARGAHRVFGRAPLSVFGRNIMRFPGCFDFGQVIQFCRFVS